MKNRVWLFGFILSVSACCCSCVIFGCVSQSIEPQQIELQIAPRKVFLLKFGNGSEILIFYALFVGFDEKNEVQFRCTDIPLLQSEAGGLGYPIDYHKKLTYLSANSKLVIRVYREGQGPKEIKLPNDMNKKILQYLKIDTTCEEYDCWHFFKCVFFDKQTVDKSRVCFTALNPNDEIKPGDGIAIVNSSGPKHWAIALGDDLYISKFGIGGGICMTSIQQMLKYFGCNCVYKIGYKYRS